MITSITRIYIAGKQTSFLVSKNWSRCEEVMGLSPSRGGAVELNVVGVEEVSTIGSH